MPAGPVMAGPVPTPSADAIGAAAIAVARAPAAASGLMNFDIATIRDAYHIDNVSNVARKIPLTKCNRRHTQ
ncbi:hypothetical protein MKUB_17850 [Mycobacterium kubicae]|uniref:Uncharacterized protein n=1 Tax=Mycobacterium kubicae TaxID=120959 RepID=A0ABQ1BKS5_9MYCO|nr:hypothetical protein MKUB_17850 [Mycobacterium kubicae]